MDYFLGSSGVHDRNQGRNARQRKNGTDIRRGAAGRHDFDDGSMYSSGKSRISAGYGCCVEVFGSGDFGWLLRDHMCVFCCRASSLSSGKCGEICKCRENSAGGDSHIGRNPYGNGCAPSCCAGIWKGCSGEISGAAVAGRSRPAGKCAGQI